jgi:hypothetical protein
LATRGRSADRKSAADKKIGQIISNVYVTDTALIGEMKRLVVEKVAGKVAASLSSKG